MNRFFSLFKRKKCISSVDTISLPPEYIDTDTPPLYESLPPSYNIINNIEKIINNPIIKYKINLSDSDIKKSIEIINNFNNNKYNLGAYIFNDNKFVYKFIKYLLETNNNNIINYIIKNNNN